MPICPLVITSKVKLFSDQTRPGKRNEWSSQSFEQLTLGLVLSQIEFIEFISSQFSLNNESSFISTYPKILSPKERFILVHLSTNLIAKKFNFFPLILKPFTVSPEFTSTLVKQKFQAALKLLKISSSLKLCQLCFNARIAGKNIWSGNLN